jgi:hypothetical protein
MPYITLPIKYVQLLFHRYNLDLILKHIAFTEHASRALLLYDLSLYLFLSGLSYFVFSRNRSRVWYEGLVLGMLVGYVYSVQWATNSGERLELLKEYQVVYSKRGIS